MSKTPTKYFVFYKKKGVSNMGSMFDFISALIGGLFIGAFCGALSLIVGIVKKKKVLGLVGFLVSVLFGVIMTTVLSQPAFLSIIPSAIFAGIIFVLSRK